MDGLRALAVLAVVLYHLDLSDGRATGGYLGVEVFFVVSGYLITGLLLREHRGDGSLDLPRFWARRARRLLPAVVAVVVAVCAFGALFHRGDSSGVRGDAVAGLFYAQNWHAIFGSQSYFASFGRPSPLQHLWSLSIEEQFYLVWPVLLLVGLRYLPRRAVFGLTIAGAGASVWLMARYADITSLNRAYYGTDTRAFGLLIGAALAFVWQPGRRFVDVRGKHAPWAIDVVALVALFALVWQLQVRSEYDPWTFPNGLLWVDLLALALIVAAATVGSKVGRVLSLPAFVWVGRRSYSIYLWHWPVFAFTLPAIDLALTGWPANALRLAIVIVLAELSYRFVEQPFRDGRAQAWLKARAGAAGKVRRVQFGGAFGAVAAVAVIVVALALAGDGGANAQHGDQTALVSVGAAATSTPLAPLRPVSAAGARFDPGTRTTVTTTTPSSTSRPPEVTTTTTTVPVTTAPAAAPSVHGVGGAVDVIGDSVALGAEPALRERFSGLVLDAAVGRQADQVVDVVEGMAAQDRLGPTVIVHTGNNGPIPDGALDDLKAAVGNRRLVLVTVHVPRRWEGQVNDTIHGFVAQHPDVGLVDWSAVAAADPGLTVQDGVHLTSAGMARYGDLLAGAVA